LSNCFSASQADDFICHPYEKDEFLARVLRRLSPQGKDPSPLFKPDFRLLAGLVGLPSSGLDLFSVLQHAVAALGLVMEVQRCSFTLVRGSEKFGSVVASNDDFDLSDLKIDLEKYPEIREAIRNAQPLLIANVNKHPLFAGLRSQVALLGFTSLLVLPLLDSKRIYGVLSVRTDRKSEGFSGEEISFCQLIAGIAASALSFSRLTEQQNPGEVTAQIETLDDAHLETRGSLLDMAAHDLRVLVSVIDGYCLLLQETGQENLSPQQVEFVEGLTTGCRRLVELTNNLLDFSRIESGKLEFDLVEIDLRRLIETAAQEILPLMTRRGIKLNFNSPAEPIPAWCDIENIRRVFYNLMSNAIKFTPKGGGIDLEFSVDDQQACVSVADTGPGIPPQLFPRLFDKFSHSRSPDGQYGNGLGLSICKLILDAHHGRIWAESVVGQGSRFTFCLPRAPR
jgi:signal transduction histidine kinase